MMEMKKILAVGIILLFIGVAVAPSINPTVVKASDDNDLVEVTTQACGIKGFGNTTVKLTREQYQNLEAYLVEFRVRLNQTTTRDEAVPIFNEAVVELNKYELLPRGMSIEKAQHLVTRGMKNHTELPLNNKLRQELSPVFFNMFCLVSATVSWYRSRPPYYLNFAPISIGPLMFVALFSIPLAGLIYLLGGEILADWLIFVAIIVWFSFPIRFMNLILFGDGYSDIQTIGLKGRVTSDDFDVSAFVGYTGLMINLGSYKEYFFGYALAVR
jgi:hypothetical protein